LRYAGCVFITMEDGRNVNEETKSISRSAKRDEEAVVTAQPGVGIEMGRFAENIACPWCGFEGPTKLDYWFGAKGACCCMCICEWMSFGAGGGTNMLPSPHWIGYLVMIGIPFCLRVSFWDAQHHCSNCTRKIGYNRQQEKCCCWNSIETKRMPQN